MHEPHDNQRSRWFSPHHFARDLIGALAPLTLFLLIAAVVFPELASQLWGYVEEISESSATAFTLVSIPIYALAGSLVGHTANKLFFVCCRMLRRSETGSIGFDALYEPHKQAIDVLTDTYFESPAQLVLEERLGKQSGRMCNYLRRFNPDGYLHVYRSYTHLAIFRQCLIYSMVLSTAYVVAQLTTCRVLAPGCLIGLLVLCSMFYRIQKDEVRSVVRVEFDFIVTTDAWLRRAPDVDGNPYFKCFRETDVVVADQRQPETEDEPEQ